MSKEHEFLIRARYCEIDGMKIVHNSKYLVYFEEARVDLVRQNNYPYEEIEKSGYLMPISEAKVIFKKSIYYDELVTIKVSIEYIKSFSTKFIYKIYKEDKSLACEGHTIHACIDKNNNNFIELPDKLVNLLKTYLINK